MTTEDWGRVERELEKKNTNQAALFFPLIEVHLGKEESCMHTLKLVSPHRGFRGTKDERGGCSMLLQYA